MAKTWTNKLYLVTILFFSLGIFNILFAWLGFICLTLPFILLIKNGKKTWCQNYCPRVNFFTVLFQNRSLTGKSAPQWLTKGDAKWFFLVYFSVNLFMLTMSTIMVFKGRIEAVEKIRFLIAFQIPWNLPQFITINHIPEWAIHLSFRIYSIMFTTTVLGLVLAWIYKPRTWCTVCPINTLSDLTLNTNQKKSKSYSQVS